MKNQDTNITSEREISDGEKGDGSKEKERMKKEGNKRTMGLKGGKSFQEIIDDKEVTNDHLKQ